MRIVIDLQGAQTSGSRHRGIGRYSLALAQAIVRLRGEHEILIALNGLFSDSIEPIRAAFADLLPAHQLLVWHAPSPVSHADPANQFRRRSAELLREAFLTSLRPDLVLVSSLFEGFGDDAVTSIGQLSSQLPTAVILYDLIPLILRRPYLDSPVVERWYESKLDHLRRADLLLAISESSRQEGMRHLGFDADACISISTAADPHFEPRQIDPATERELRARYSLTRPFLMYTGGIDHRKNIEGLIRAYAMLPASLRAEHQLAIICSIQPHNRHELEQLARQHKLGPDDLVLTGFVPDADLVALYNLCKAFVFPSWHEGFGLPALEAMACGRAVVAANTTSLPEVVGLDDALFDPRDDNAIAAKLQQVLADEEFRARLERHGIVQAQRFSWDASARRALDAIEAWHTCLPGSSPATAPEPALATAAQPAPAPATAPEPALASAAQPAPARAPARAPASASASVPTHAPALAFACASASAPASALAHAPARAATFQPRRPRLAYVAPLPPARSGIADYSAELLPELARHYAIDVVAPQHEFTDPWTIANCALRSVEWFVAHANQYERVLYHFGNSHFHQHMFALLERVPGVVVLHDFFLSGAVAHMDLTAYQSGIWAASLYQSHGYAAVVQRFHAPDPATVVWTYPCNLDVVRGALGTIVHSVNSRRLTEQWYGAPDSAGMHVIPHLRVPAPDFDRSASRQALGIGQNDTLICSFGLLGPTKLNARLLDAWLASSLAADPRCVLVFVGENEHGDYGADLAAVIRQRGAGRVRITGWADMAVFRQYLAAADGAVQLRTHSRGETSGTVLDCMNYGLATIVNANGSNADLPDDGVLKLDDQFDDAQLVAALERLAREVSWREQLGARAKQIVKYAHAPRACADQYAHTIEAAYQRTPHLAPNLTRAMAQIEPGPVDAGEWAALAEALTQSIAPALVQRQYLVDVSSMLEAESIAANASSGAAAPIALGARVSSATAPISLGAHGELLALLKQPPPGIRIEPVYVDAQQVCRYARRFTLRLLACPDNALVDEPVELRAGDLWLTPAASPTPPAQQQRLRDAGVQIAFC
jgi:glycosyltransferase involved in cell wall biosynthesis